MCWCEVTVYVYVYGGEGVGVVVGVVGYLEPLSTFVSGKDEDNIQVVQYPLATEREKVKGQSPCPHGDVSMVTSL